MTLTVSHRDTSNFLHLDLLQNILLAISFNVTLLYSNFVVYMMCTMNGMTPCSMHQFCFNI